MDLVAKMIPSTASVSVTNNIGSHFSERQYLYNYPEMASSAAYTVVLLGDQFAWPSGDQQKQILESLLKNSSYRLIARKDNFYAFKRVSP